MSAMWTKPDDPLEVQDGRAVPACSRARRTWSPGAGGACASPAGTSCPATETESRRRCEACITRNHPHRRLVAVQPSRLPPPLPAQGQIPFRLVRRRGCARPAGRNLAACDGLSRVFFSRCAKGGRGVHSLPPRDVLSSGGGQWRRTFPTDPSPRRFVFRIHVYRLHACRNPSRIRVLRTS